MNKAETEQHQRDLERIASKPKVHIRSIKAKGNMVEVTDTNGVSILIQRKEALYRARAISVNHDAAADYLIEMFIDAVNQARINDPEFGEPYSSASMKMLLATRPQSN